MDTLSKFFNVFIIVFGMFIVTTLISAKQADRVMEESVTTTVTKFSDDVRRQGRLTAEMYNSFIKKLDAEGILFNIDMTYTKEIYSPESAGTTSIGASERYINTEECYYTQEILDGLYNGDTKAGSLIDGKADGVLYFNKNDTFTIHVTNKTKTFGQKFSKFIPWLATTKYGGIDTRAGGLIRDEREVE